MIHLSLLPQQMQSDKMFLFVSIHPLLLKLVYLQRKQPSKVSLSSNVAAQFPIPSSKAPSPNGV